MADEQPQSRVSADEQHNYLLQRATQAAQPSASESHHQDTHFRNPLDLTFSFAVKIPVRAHLQSKISGTSLAELRKEIDDETDKYQYSLKQIVGKAMKKSSIHNYRSVPYRTLNTWEVDGPDQTSGQDEVEAGANDEAARSADQGSANDEAGMCATVVAGNKELTRSGVIS